MRVLSTTGGYREDTGGISLSFEYSGKMILVMHMRDILTAVGRSVHWRDIILNVLGVQYFGGYDDHSRKF